MKQILVGGNQDGKFKKLYLGNSNKEIICLKKYIIFVDLGMKYEAGRIIKIICAHFQGV